MCFNKHSKPPIEKGTNTNWGKHLFTYMKYLLDENEPADRKGGDSENSSCRTSGISAMNLKNMKGTRDREGRGSKLLEASDQKPYSQPRKSSDLVLYVEGRKFHVHRTLLTVASQVFETMFTSHFKEKSAPEIPLPGKRAGDIEQLLDFIYPDKDFILSKENCFPLFKLANEYQIERLIEECQNFLSDWCQEKMDEDKAMEALVVSQMYPVEEEIVGRCKNIIATAEEAWQEIKQHRLFTKLKPETVQCLMEKRIAYFEGITRIKGISSFDRSLVIGTRRATSKRSRFFNS